MIQLFVHTVLLITYRVSTEIVSNVSRQSWWPLPQAWFAGGRWVGHWTAECEVWYELRKAALASFEHPSELLRTSIRWKKGLHASADAHKLYTKNVKLAEDALAIMLSQTVTQSTSKRSRVG
jgi:hypothetical protein